MRMTPKMWSVLFYLTSQFVVAQNNGYSYKRALSEHTNTWHSVVLTDSIFAKTQTNLADLRILGMTASGDSVEVPYLLMHSKPHKQHRDIAFTVNNQSFSNKAYYYTLEANETAKVNQIYLDFDESNFDWRITLEGSHNQTEWFTLANDYRIVSIQNTLTNFSFTTLKFPIADFRFYRVAIHSPTRPHFRGATMQFIDVPGGFIQEHPIRNMEVMHNKTEKTTEVIISLAIKTFVSQLAFEIRDAVDYYRPITISYLSDSSETSKGMTYHFTTLTQTTLHSLDDNLLNFESVKLDRLKLIIHNNDNPPLDIANVLVKGYQYELAARFTQPAEYFLVYGNPTASAPQYDLEVFADKVPIERPQLTLGTEIQMAEVSEKVVTPLFSNRLWLYGIMAIVMVLLVGFSIQMLRKSDAIAGK